EVNQEQVNELINELTLDYKQENRGIRLSESQDSYYLTTKPEHNVYFKQLLNNYVQTKLSQAALQTLAIIAYNQTLTFVDIENIRGVNSYRTVQTLVARSLIEEK